MTKKTKDFKNPALTFMSIGEEQIISQPKQGVPMKPNPLYLETKSRRLQLLVKPSIYIKIKAIATAQDKSLNDLINTILEQYIEREE